MIKNLSYLSAVSVGVMLSGSVFAAPTAMPGSGTITSAQCIALDNNVKVQLSKGVVAAYECTDLSLKAATCHTSGTNKQQSHTCTYTQDEDSSGVPIAGAYTASAPAVCPSWTSTLTDADKAVNFTGPLAYGGKSGGGTVGPRQLNEKTCANNTIGTAVTDMN